MQSIQLVAYVSLTVVVLATAPVLYVLVREAWRRRRARQEQHRDDDAYELLVRLAPNGTQVATLKARFDVATLERALWRMLRAGIAVNTAQLAASLGLTDRFLHNAQHATGWGDRAHAAEMLGLLGDPRGCEVLVRVLRDPYEDVTVKRAASEALGRIRDPSVVEALVDQLLIAGPHEAPRIAELLVSFGDACVDRVLSYALGAPQQECRMWSARILGRVRVERAAQPLMGCFVDTSEPVRAAAAEALGSIGSPAATECLLEVAQKDPAPRVRAEAARALGAIGDTTACDTLRDALRDPDHATRLRALEALATIRPGDTEPLERMLRDVNPLVQKRAALALDRIGFVDSCLDSLALHGEQSAAAGDALRVLSKVGLHGSIMARALRGPPAVRASIVEILADSGVPEVGQHLIQCAGDEDPNVRAGAARGLGTCKPQGAVDKLLELLHDPNELVSTSAAGALASLPPASLELHASTLRDAFFRSAAPGRMHLVSVLAGIDDGGCHEAVVHAAGDPDVDVRTAAVSLLPRLPRGVSIRPLMDRIHDPSPIIRLAAIDGLGAFHHEEAREALFEQLPEADAVAREHIAGSLARFGVEGLSNRLEAIVTEGTTGERLGAAWALGKTGDPLSVFFLARLIRDDEPRVRASAAGALGKIDTDESADALAGSVIDPDPRTRAAAVNALGRLGRKKRSSVELVRGRLLDPDAFVRNRAALCLAQLEPESFQAIGATVEQSLDRVSFTIALAVAGTRETVGRVALSLRDGEFRATVLGAVRREPEHVREAFGRALQLDDLGALSSDRAVGELVDQQRRFLRSSTDSEARKRAVAILGGLGTPTASSVLGDVLCSDPVPEVRAQAADALGRFEPSTPVRTALVAALGDPAMLVSASAARSVGGLGDPSMFDALIARLPGAPSQLAEAIEDALVELLRKDPLALSARLLTTAECSVVVAGLHVLQRLDSDDLVPAVRALLRSPNADIRVEALRAASALAADTFQEEIADALGTPDPTIRETAVQIVAGRHPSRFLPQLSERTLDPSADVRCALAVAVESLEPSKGSEIVDALLKDPVPRVRARMMVTLLGRGSDDDLESFHAAHRSAASTVIDAIAQDPRAETISATLARRLDWHPNAGVRLATVVGLRALASPEMDKHLVAALLDPSPAVRSNVVRALSASTDPAIRQRLREALDDPSEDVRDEARRANLRLVRSSA